MALTNVTELKRGNANEDTVEPFLDAFSMNVMRQKDAIFE